MCEINISGNCDNQETDIWSPNWIDANSGPQTICQTCLDSIANDVWTFFYGPEAKTVFQSVHYLDRSDAKYNLIKQMVQKSPLVAGIQHPKKLTDFGIFRVNDDLWMVNLNSVAKLGTIQEAKTKFPKLFLKRAA